MNTKRELLTRLRQIIREHRELKKRLPRIPLGPIWAPIRSIVWTYPGHESSLNVDIPHLVGERLNTVGQTVDHLLILMRAPSDACNIRMETVTTWQQWVAVSKIRTRSLH